MKRKQPVVFHAGFLFQSGGTMSIQRLAILHSNDMHGDFLEEEKDGMKTGGLARLAGYVNDVRESEENVIYAIAGDMFRGSIIDSEYPGFQPLIS